MSVQIENLNLFKKTGFAAALAAGLLTLSACSSNTVSSVEAADEEPFRDEYANAVDGYEEQENEQPAAEPVAVAVTKDMSVDTLVHFDFDSAQLREEEKAKIDALVSQFKNYDIKNVRIALDGYADAIGPDEYNEALSRDRAKAVRDYFASLQVNVADWDVDAYGENNPIATNETPIGRQMNRRVELIMNVEATELGVISARK